MVYPLAVRQGALDLLAKGCSARDAARRMRVSATIVKNWAKLAGMQLRVGASGGLGGLELEFPEGRDWVDGRGQLTEAARVAIELRLADGHRPARIARELGVHRVTVGREIARGSSGGRYRALHSHARAIENRAREKDRSLDDPELRAAVIERLNNRFSPQQISQDLRNAFPGRDDMRVSHETIYQALYVQGKGGLRHELTVEKATRQGRKVRRPQSRLPRRSNKGWIGEAHISTRPAEVEDRAVPGHWEGDLIIGTDGTTALITLVERTTRFTLIRRLPLTHDSATVADSLITMMGDLPAQLRQTLTWDQGVEMAAHATFTLASDCQVYFCDPHSPWQRGTNENTNGLIRDFFPKGTNFADVSDHDIAECQRLLNIRPRQTLDWATPGDKLKELLVVAPTT